MCRRGLSNLLRGKSRDLPGSAERKGRDMKQTKHVKAARAFLLAAAAACLFPTVTAYAVEGWNKVGDEWQYLNREDQPVTNAFKKSKEDWFYLGDSGVLLKNRIFSYGGSDYYVDQDGRMAKNAWVFIDHESDPAGDYGNGGWHYFGADGKGYRAKGKGFRKEIDGQYYAFDENGNMLTGWIDEEGNVLSDEDPFVNARYYADADGALYTNRWLYYDWGSHLTSEVTGRSYEDYEKMWFYFGADSKKYRSRAGEQPFQRDINGATYGFDEKGVMIEWWDKVASISNAVRSNPTADERVRYYDGYDGGPLMKNKWLWMYPAANLDENEYLDLESSWWRTDSKGRAYRNKILKVGGREYAFDGIGRMQTGFVLFDRAKSEFVAQYDVDAWSAKDFIEGNMYGIEKADLYLFSPDEMNDGSMQAGKEITVELADGPRTFAFAPSGKAYGNRNYLQKKDNKFYINGLRLDAPEEAGYGVVIQNVGTLSTPQYRFFVVDKSGKIVSGRRVLNTGEGYILVYNGQFIGFSGDEDAPRWRNSGSAGAGFYHYDRSERDHFARGLIAGPNTTVTKNDVPDDLALFIADPN